MNAPEAVDVLDAALRSLPDLHRDAALLSGPELAEVSRTVLGVMQWCEATVVGLTTEAIARGTIAGSTAAGAAQWISRLATGESAATVLGTSGVGASGGHGGAGPLVSYPPEPGSELAPAAMGVRCENDVPAVGFVGIEPAHARRLAKLAEAGCQQRHRSLTAAVLGGHVSTSVAATALREVPKVAAVLPNAGHEEIYGWFLQLDPGAGATAVRRLTQQVLHRYAPEGELDRAEETLSRHERLSFGQMPCGMVQLVAELSPDHAALLRHAIESLAAPSPASSCCDSPHHRHSDGAQRLAPDERNPSKRRADALVLLVQRAAELIDADPQVSTSGTASMVVTLDLDALTGELRRLGRTEHGEALAPSTVRRLACDAGIIPMVLGGDGEPLDVGRSKRLVTGGLRRAVIERDRQCTFPGCRRPPPWCQVHHVRPWHAGGATSLENSALLCQSHHTVVHQRAYSATVTKTGVQWDAREGLICRWLGAA
ncbi:DUF222 domain-containing protein [Dermacoccaceae bacterium W4C1]